MVVAPHHDSELMTLPAGATLASYIRVKIDSSGLVQAAGVTDRAIGYLTERGAVSGANCTVRLLGTPINAVANAALEVGDVLFAAAAGRVDDTDAGTGLVVGIALTAATAQDQIVTVLQCDYI